MVAKEQSCMSFVSKLQVEMHKTCLLHLQENRPFPKPRSQLDLQDKKCSPFFSVSFSASTLGCLEGVKVCLRQPSQQN